MAGVLKPAEHHQADEVAYVQTVRRRVASVVDTGRTFGELCPQVVTFSRIVDEVAGFEVCD
jgi:hypothetical protein